MPALKKKLLLIEEDYVYYLFVLEILSVNFEITRAISINEALNMLQKDSSFDITLFNLVTSCSEKREMLTELAAYGQSQNLLIITDEFCCSEVKQVEFKEVYFIKNISEIIHIEEIIMELLEPQKTLV